MNMKPLNGSWEQQTAMEAQLNRVSELGCRIERDDQDPPRWGWSYGVHARSSNDHYGVSFATAGEAAGHFLKSREGQAALRRVNK